MGAPQCGHFMVMAMLHLIYAGSAKSAAKSKGTRRPVALRSAASVRENQTGIRLLRSMPIILYLFYAVNRILHGASPLPIHTPSEQKKGGGPAEASPPFFPVRALYSTPRTL
jgi:hypothetical protein